MSDGDGDSNGDGDESSVDDLLHKNQLSAKQELDEQKEALLIELPKGYKDKFGAIGFCKWSRKWLPALIRGPYDVGPGDTRRKWMDAYENLKAKGRVHKLPYLVYWYRARDQSENYSFIPSSNFVLLENEEKLKKLKIQYKLPMVIQAKLDNGESLTKTEENILRPLLEMLEDVDKKPKDRKGGDVNFQGARELITVDDVNCIEQEGENYSPDDERPKPIVEKKKGKPGRKPNSKALPAKRKTVENATPKGLSSLFKLSEIEPEHPGKTHDLEEETPTAKKNKENAGLNSSSNAWPMKRKIVEDKENPKPKRNSSRSKLLAIEPQETKNSVDDSPEAVKWSSS